jgi:hypothetical protein
VHSEHASGAGKHGAGEFADSGYGERAETYLRLLAESALRADTDVRADDVRRAADILVDAGVLSHEQSSQIVDGMQLALRVRGRPTARTATWRLQRLSSYSSGQPTAGQPTAGRPIASQATWEFGGQHPWRVLPAGPGTPGSRLMALITTADRAIAPVTLYFPPEAGPPESGTPPFTQLTGTDDLGASYRLGFGDGTWTGSAWTGPVMFFPAPPATARWLAIISPNGQLLRADLTVAPHRDATSRAAIEPAAESPGERLLARKAEALLAGYATSYSADPHAGLAEVVAVLERAGALSPLSPAHARLAALEQLLGLPGGGPACQVPARWTALMASYGRRRRPAPLAGTAAIGAGLPELGGARLAIAGLHSGGSGTFLHLVVAGLGPMPIRRPDGPPWDTGLSWWFRDDAGGWHLGVFEDVSPVGGPEGLLRIALLPPLSHPTASLTVEITGTTQQVTADLPVLW